MIKIQGQYTLEDFKNAQRLHLQSGKSGSPLVSQASFLLLFVGVMIVLASAFVLMEGVAWTYILPMIFILVFFVFFQFYGRPRQIARVFEQQKELSAPLEIELSEDGFGSTNQYGTGRIPWKDFAKWKEDQALFLLYRSDVMFNFLPKRFLAGEDQVQYVRDLLVKNNVPDARKAGRSKRSIFFLILFLLFIVVASMTYFSIR